MKINSLLLFLLLILPAVSLAQKTMVDSPEKVSELATAELDTHVRSEGFQKQLLKQGIVGEYTFTIGVKDKGMISSMSFVSKSENASVKGQNFLNDLTKKYKFDFKVPKGNFYKFEYTFRL